MSAPAMKVPKIEVEEEKEAKPPISSLIPNNPPVKSTSSTTASTSARIRVRHTVLKAPPTAVTPATNGLKVPKTEVVEEGTSISSQILNNPPVKRSTSDLAPIPIPASVRAPVPVVKASASASALNTAPVSIPILKRPASAITPNPAPSHVSVKPTSSAPASALSTARAPVPLVKASASSSIPIPAPVPIPILKKSTSALNPNRVPSHVPVKSTSSASAPMAQAPPTASVSSSIDTEIKEMKEGFVEMKEETKEEFCQMKKEMAKLTNGFDRTAREMGDFRLKIQAQLNSITPASARVPVTQAPPKATVSSSIEKEFQDMKEQFSNIKGEFLIMKGEFLQMKGAFRQGKEEMANLTKAFDRESKDGKDFRREVRAELNNILNALSQQIAPVVNQNLPQIPIVSNPNPYGPHVPSLPQQPGSIPLFLRTTSISQTPSSNPTPVNSGPPVQNEQPKSGTLERNSVALVSNPAPVQKNTTIRKKQPKPQCVLCNTGKHNVEHCPSFPTNEKRRDAIKAKNLCLKCLKRLNNVQLTVHNNCLIKRPCKNCNGNDHRTSFCDKEPVKKPQENKKKIPVDKIVPAGSHRHAPY